MYSMWDDEGEPGLGLEVRPSLLFTGAGLEPRLDGAFVAPFAKIFAFRFGGGMYTFGGALFWTIQGGVSVTL
jgi:hypothetical protein